MTETNTQRQAVREKVDFDEDALTGKISDVIAALQAAQASVPEEYRAGAGIEVEAHGGYEGSASLSAEVFYERPETDAEMSGRLWFAGRREKQTDAQERREYERLRAKFG